MSEQFLEAALGYAERDWPVVALKPGAKVPAGGICRHGLHDATTDAATIRRWWRAEPRANVGLLTGVAFDVLDVDGDLGMAALVVEMPFDGPAVNGPTVTTGKGAHVYVAPTGLGNRAGVVAHVDWRGRGGYIVAPPSVHPSGATYYWHCGESDPDFGVDAPIRPAPAWLLAMLDRRTAPSAPTAGTTDPGRPLSAYARRALESEAGKVLLAPVGERNDTLNRAAFALGQLVAGAGLDVDEVIGALLVAAERCGLEANEARRTIASGLAAGAVQPRRGAAA